MSDSTFQEIHPDNTTFVLVSFEGPDRYSTAGGLGVRVTELSEALGEAGFETHLFFIGAPHAPHHEVRGRCHLWRCCPEEAARFPDGVYQGEGEKLEAFGRMVPPLVFSQVAQPAQEAGKLLVVMGEDWHTAGAMVGIHDQLRWQGIRHHALLLWNANSIFGFDAIDWERLGQAATITAVSRYMKQVLWRYKVNALVLPNGIPDRFLAPVATEAAQQLQAMLPDRLLLTKFARFDPDKNWIAAVQAVARLRTLEQRPLFFVRGGMEGYGAKVLTEIDNLGLRRYDLVLAQPSMEEFLAAVAANHHDTDVFFLRFFVPEAVQRMLYRACHAVLANSTHEPFGLVGLEVMAAQGVAFVGATGESYAQHLTNAISLDTNDPNELVGNLLYLQQHPAIVSDLRRVGRITARFYTWPRIIAKIRSKLQYLLMSGGTTWP